jgi:hypothetical protein
MVLAWVAICGLALLGLGYLAYLARLVPLSVPIEAIAENWHLRAEELTEKLHLPHGWAWTADWKHADVLSFATVVFLASGTIACLAATFVSFIREKDAAYAIIVLLQIAVLLVAASGIGGGPH